MKRSLITTLMSLAALGSVSLAARESSAMTSDNLTSSGRYDPQATGYMDESGVSVVRSALTVTPTVTTGPGQTSPTIAYNGSDSFGNSRFGADYGLTSYVEATSSGYGYALDNFSANATVFGEHKNLVTSQIYALTSVPAQVANVYYGLSVLGNTVRSGTKPGGDYVNGTTYLSNLSQQIWSKSTNFTLGVIPLTITAAVYAGAYQQMSGHFWIDGVEGNLSHGARIWVSASAGVGISGASAGVKVNNLNLIDVSLPLTAKARFNNRFNYSGCFVDATLASNFGLTLQALGGQIELYANFLWWSYDHDFYDIPVIRRYYPLQTVAPVTTWALYPTCMSIPAAPQYNGYIIG
jgi:hypothetical protein